MTIEELRKNIQDALRSWFPRSLLSGCVAIDFILKDYNRWTSIKDWIEEEGYFTDEDSIDYGIEQLCSLFQYFTEDDLPADLMWAHGGMTWTVFTRAIGISNENIGDLRTLLKENKCSLTGLTADIALHNYGDCTGVKKTIDAAMLFLGRLRDYQASENHNDDNLWYLTFNGKIGKCLYGGENCWGQRHIENTDVEFDPCGYYIANREITGEGCCFVRHRPIIARIGTDWSPEWLSKIEEYFDGGCDCTMIIDQDFKKAYDPRYSDSSAVLDGDFVCGYSCMSNRGDDAQKFYGNIEGCYVVRFENANGEQVGRCIMYEYDGVRHFIRLYALRDYQNRANMMLKAEMRDGDIRGRDERICGMKLPVHWDEDTPNMYLDGSAYGLEIIGDEMYITDSYDYDLKSTSEDTLLSRLGVHKCAQCGRWHRCIRACDEYYCSSNCARAAGLIKCDYCGKWYPRDYDGDIYIEYDNKHYCSEGCAEGDGYRKCEHCGDWRRKYEMIFTAQGKYYCTDECALEDGLRKCSLCNRYTKDWQIAGGKVVDVMTAINYRDKFQIIIKRKYNKRTKDENNNN